MVEGKVVELKDVEAIASLPSKEELISKIMFLINCQAQRFVTVLSAVPRNLAIVVKQIGEQKGGEEPLNDFGLQIAECGFKSCKRLFDPQSEFRDPQWDGRARKTSGAICQVVRLMARMLLQSLRCS